MRQHAWRLGMGVYGVVFLLAMIPFGVGVSTKQAGAVSHSVTASCRQPWEAATSAGGIVCATGSTHQEYPRPDFGRDNWLSLNGAWAFALDPNEQGVAGRWYEWGMPGSSVRFDRRIIVPFPWQSLAAFGQGAEATRFPGVVNGPLAAYEGTVWYGRVFTVPATFPAGDRVVLNFGAAEQSARVWVNGRLAGSHEGGYLPFALDISDLLVSAGSGRANTLVVQVTQPHDLTGYPHGKQGGFWYTRSGGLWQSVWLTANGPVEIKMLHVTPDPAHGQARVDLTVAGRPFRSVRVVLVLSDPLGRRVGQETISLGANVRKGSAVLSIAHPLLWDTAHPWLYHLTATVRPQVSGGETVPSDTVHTYFGMRTVTVGHIVVQGQRYSYIFLNGHPLYIRGALDQNFNPWGVYTAPSDAFTRDDIQRAKDLGLNLLRIHIMVPDPRLLYWADTLGLLIWEEPPDFAEDGASFTPAALSRWRDNLTGMIARDYNHPATIIWGLFNEEWGLGDLRNHPDRARWLASVYTATKQQDPTRLVVDQSGWSHTRTDIFDVHEYLADFGSWRVFLDTLNQNLFPGSTVSCGCISGNHDGFVFPYAYTDQPVLMSEYAAGPWTGDWPNTSDAKPDGFRDNSAPFRWLTNDLWLHPAIAGYIYTQYSDVEWEHNGLMRYDRTTRDFGYAPAGLYPGFADTVTPRTVNTDNYLALNRVPVSALDPGQTMRVPVWFSHFGPLVLPRSDGAILHWRIAGYDGTGRWVTGPTMTRAVTVNNDPIAQLTTISVTAPSAAFAGDLAVWLQAGKSAEAPVLTRNAVALAVAPQVRLGLTQTVVRPQGQPAQKALTWTWEPGQFSVGTFSDVKPVRAANGQVVWAGGSGYLDYRLTIPDAVRRLFAAGKLVGIRMQAEAGASRRPSALDDSSSQTDQSSWPTDVQVSLQGVPLLTQTLPNDPSDTRGILSLLNNYQWGEYGYPVGATLAGNSPGVARVSGALRDLPASATALTLRFAVPSTARHRGGLTLYGEQVGRIPAPLSLTLTFAAS